MHLPMLLSCIVLMFAVTSRSMATIVYSSAGATYTQDFDSLASSGSDIGWTNDSTIAGWHLFRVTNSSDSTPYPIASYEVTNGNASDARFYSFGSDSSSERALGGIGNGRFGDSSTTTDSIGFGNTLGWIAASITNSTGNQLTSFTLQYDGEQWSDASADPQTMVFEYGFGATFASVATWSMPGSGFDFESPQNGGAGAIDGNGVGRVANLGGTVTNLTWQSSSTLWLRWVELNDAGGDHGLAIDNLSFSATSSVAAVPEANAATSVGLLSAVIALCAIGKRCINLCAGL